LKILDSGSAKTAVRNDGFLVNGTAVSLGTGLLMISPRRKARRGFESDSVFPATNIICNIEILLLSVYCFSLRALRPGESNLFLKLF